MLSAEAKAETDNTHRDLDYLGYYKTIFYNFIIHCFEENNDNHTRRRVRGNHALRAQPTD